MWAKVKNLQGWVGADKSRFNDCLQQSKNEIEANYMLRTDVTRCKHVNQ